MSTIHHKAAGGVATPATDPQVERPSNFAYRALAALRIAFGLTFLWAFFDKLLALGFSTGRADDGTVDRFGDAAWVNGGSPTEGFLKFGADGPFKGFYNSIAGSAWADTLFMLGLLAIGLALVLGIGMRIAAVSGTLMMALMWAAEWPPAQHTSAGEPTMSTNPLIDYHVVYALVLIALAATASGVTWGLAHWWNGLPVVKANPWLR